MIRKHSICLFLVASIFFSAKASFIEKVDRKSFGTLENKLLFDQNVIITTDRFCSMGKTFLTEKISLKHKKKNFSRVESQLIVLENKITLNELEQIAQEDNCVLSVSKDIPAELFEIPNDPKLEKQPHLDAIQYKETFDFFSQVTQKSAVIAIIDNGLDIKHEDLKDNLWVNLKEKNGFPGIDDDENGYVDDIHGYDFMEKIGDPNHKNIDSAPVNSHGTHVAALAAATTNNAIGVSGVMAKNVKIMGLNVFGKNSYSNFAVIDTAIRYAADMGANVINMSLGGKGIASSTEKAIKYAISKNVFVVVAAGNNGEELTDENFYSPASFGKNINGMIAVGAVDTGRKLGELCGFSNYSRTYVEMSAPGCHVVLGASGLLSAFKNNQYGYMSGTSMASPVAAGVATLAFNYLRDKNHKLKPAKLEEFLKNGSKSSPLLESDIQEGKTVDLQSLKDKIISDDR